METTPTWAVLIIQFALTAITLYSTRRKTGAEATRTDAEASQILGGSWKQLADELQEQLNAQDRRMRLLQETIDGMRVHQAEQDKRIAEQDATIAEQGGIIMQLRDRVTELEQENGHLKAENNALRNRSTKI